MEIGERGAFNRIVVTGAGKWDDALFTGVRIDHEALEAGRDHFVVFGEKKNSRHATGARVRDAVEFGRNFERHRTGEEPQVPPAELPQNDLTHGDWIVENESGDFSSCGDVKRRDTGPTRSRTWAAVFTSSARGRATATSRGARSWSNSSAAFTMGAA